ncbi:MAG TPA: ATP-binding protein [Solirubrobacteraceae bacterium]|jgi:anti-sigma regulatory factor (Ser/Thr protein kinase)
MPTQVVELRFRHPARPAAIGRARHDVEDALGRTDVDERTSGDLMLLVSELVTNAVRHARTERFEVKLEVAPDRLRLEVHDEGGGFVPEIAPSDDGSGGYGLFIVERLADRWGVERDAGGVIWLELDRAR